LEDGNCLFRCVADRVYGDAEMHDVVRRLCLDHIARERDHFSQYITQDFDAYIARKRRDRVHGNHLEIQAISEIYNRPVHVYDAFAPSDEPMNAFAASVEGPTALPLRLSYHGRSHYNVLYDPTHADVGEGLGLPGMQPGLADRMQMSDALGASEASDVDAQVLAAARGASEVDATHDEEKMLQEALRASLSDVAGASAGGVGSTGAATFGGGEVRGGPGPPYGYGEEDLDCQVSLALAKAHAAAGNGPQATAAGGGSDGGGGGSGGQDEGGNGHGGGGGSSTIEILLAMGFSLPRAVAAHAQFGDDLDSAVESLTAESW